MVTHTHTHTHRQSIPSPEEEGWVLRADLNDAVEEECRESRVDCSRVMMPDRRRCALTRRLEVSGWTTQELSVSR